MFSSLDQDQTRKHAGLVNRCEVHLLPPDTLTITTRVHTTQGRHDFQGLIA